MLFSFLKRFTKVSFVVTGALMTYLAKETSRTAKTGMSLSGSSPISEDILNASAAASEETRRKMLDTERQAQIAAERARQTQQHQDQMRAAQARADADRARQNY